MPGPLDETCKQEPGVCEAVAATNPILFAVMAGISDLVGDLLPHEDGKFVDDDEWERNKHIYKEALHEDPAELQRHQDHIREDAEQELFEARQRGDVEEVERARAKVRELGGDAGRGLQEIRDEKHEKAVRDQLWEKWTRDYQEKYDAWREKADAHRNDGGPPPGPSPVCPQATDLHGAVEAEILQEKYGAGPMMPGASPAPSR